jgi:hypothetical protein
MKQFEIEEALTSLWVLVREPSPIVIGSQSLHGKFPDIADDIMFSREVDVILPNKVRLGRWLNEVVGDDTPYSVDRGYYIDHVIPVEGLPIFATGWESRLIKKSVMVNSEKQVLASFLSPEDLVICKLGAGRAKDFVFVEALVRRGLVALDAVEALAEGVPMAYQDKVKSGIQRINAQIDGDSNEPPTPSPSPEP